MGIPSFLLKKGNSVVFNQEGEFLFYVPEVYFTDTKLPLAQIEGQYVKMAGICDWALVNKNGSVSEAHRFYLPTIFNCKPDRLEKVKNLSLNGLRAIDYRILHFKEGDEVISNIYIPQIIDNAEAILKALLINSGKVPPSVPYNKVQDYIVDAIRINGKDYGLGKQLFGIPISESYRSDKDISEPYRYTKMKDQYSYKQIGIGLAAKYISPYVAFTSENYDESIMASIILSQDPKTDTVETPLEKVLMN